MCSVTQKGTDSIIYVTSKEAVNKGCHPPGNQWKSPVTIQDSDTRKVLPFRGADQCGTSKGQIKGRLWAELEQVKVRNQAIRSKCHTAVRKFMEAVMAKDQKDAEVKLSALTKELDTARSKGVLTRNSVSRKKSRMQKLYNVTFAAK